MVDRLKAFTRLTREQRNAAINEPTVAYSALLAIERAHYSGHIQHIDAFRAQLFIALTEITGQRERKFRDALSNLTGALDQALISLRDRNVITEDEFTCVKFQLLTYHNKDVTKRAVARASGHSGGFLGILSVALEDGLESETGANMGYTGHLANLPRITMAKVFRWTVPADTFVDRWKETVPEAALEKLLHEGHVSCK